MSPRAHLGLALFLAVLGCSSGSPGGPCASNADCVRGETCVTGTCRSGGNTTKPQCMSDAECSIGEFCDSDQLCKPIQVAGMDASSNADAAELIDSGSKLPDAAPNPDAALDAAADPDAAAALDAADAAAALDAADPDAADPDAGVVLDATALADAQTAPDAQTLPASCNLDAECAAIDPTTICVGNTCVPRCDAPTGSCPAPAVCNPASGRCLPGQLPLGAACSLDAQCSTFFCLGLTVGAASFEICSDPCSAGSDCPLDFSCTTVSGMGFCLGEALFGPPPATFDTPAGGMCTATTNTCQTGWCNTALNQCIETCTRVADCAAFGGNCYTYAQVNMGTTSYDNLCYSPATGAANGALCLTDGACRSGVCDRYQNACAAHCCSDADCASFESCAVYDLDAGTGLKICVPRSATAGSGTLGTPCATAADCESEVCIPVDPDDMASPRKCSTLCCANRDCSALPLGGACRPFNGPITGTLVGACQPN